MGNAWHELLKKTRLKKKNQYFLEEISIGKEITTI